MIRRETEARGPFARRLVALRQVFSEQKGIGSVISQAAMARLLKINHEQYRRYERGDTEPSIAVLAAIRRLTGVSLDMLLAGEQPGSTTMIDKEGQIRKELTVGDRMRIARTAIAPSLKAAAQLMLTEVGQWERWETGIEEPPLEVLKEFAHRFGVGLDFLILGQSKGVAPEVWEAMVRVHPALDPHLRVETSEPAPSSRRRKARDGDTPGPTRKPRASVVGGKR